MQCYTHSEEVLSHEDWPACLACARWIPSFGAWGVAVRHCCACKCHRESACHLFDTSACFHDRTSHTMTLCSVRKRSCEFVFSKKDFSRGEGSKWSSSPRGKCPQRRRHAPASWPHLFRMIKLLHLAGGTWDGSYHMANGPHHC